MHARQGLSDGRDAKRFVAERCRTSGQNAAPFAGLYLPGEHSTQDDAALPLELPGVQSVQFCASPFDSLPLSHAVHDVAPTAWPVAKPAGHTKQSSSVAAGEYFPKVHLVQIVSFVTKLPAEQA